MTKQEIGCCGAYCKTCLSSISGNICRGCKLGYDNGKRDINKSKCKIKICCFMKKQFETCADCDERLTCKIIQDFYRKNGYKYKKYKQSIDFIRENGYAKFLIIADTWKGPYGNLSEPLSPKQG
jgi:hypothetical protein